MPVDRLTKKCIYTLSLAVQLSENGVQTLQSTTKKRSKLIQAREAIQASQTPPCLGPWEAIKLIPMTWRAPQRCGGRHFH